MLALDVNASPDLACWPLRASGQRLPGMTLRYDQRGGRLSAYIHGQITVTDPARYKEYRQRVPAVLAAHGGRYLVRGGTVEVLEGESTATRQVILEFPDMDHLRGFYPSPEYQELLSIRKAASIGTLIAIEGV